jgi:hypothetical protein
MARLSGSMICLCLLVAACRGGGGAPSPPAVFSYNGSNAFPAVVGVAISLTPTVTGTVDSYSITPALPPGLSLDRQDGVVSGTPARASGRATYTITASSAGGSTRFRLTLSVTSPPSGLLYTSPVHTIVGAAITPLAPAIAGEVDYYDIAPALPPGLVLNNSSGVISGTPRAARILAPYRITARSFAGRSSFVLELAAIARRPHAPAALRPVSTGGIVKSSRTEE